MFEMVHACLPFSLGVDHDRCLPFTLCYALLKWFHWGAKRPAFCSTYPEFSILRTKWKPLELQNREGPGKLRVQYTAIDGKIPKKNSEKAKLLSWHVGVRRI